MNEISSRHSKAKYNRLFAALLLSIFLTQLDQTVVSTALPTIATQLDGFEGMSWVFTIYMLTSTAMMPIAGKLSDLYGRKLFIIAGLIIFTVGSVLCGLADSMLQLIIYRGIKGIGAGFLMPITFTVIFSIIPKSGNNIYQSLYMSIFALSSVVGPTIGALITSLLDWRYIFYINLPLGLLILILLLFTLPKDSATQQSDTSIGYMGPILLIAGTLSLLLALKLGGIQYRWSSIEIMLLLLVALTAWIWFVVSQLKAKQPIIPFQLFRDRVIATTYMTTFIQGIIMFGSLVYIPLFVQGSLGGNVAYTGGTLTPLMLCVMFGASLCGVLIQKYTWRFNIAVSMLLCTIGIAFIMMIPSNVSFIVICIIMICLGLGIGMMMMVGQTAISMSVDESIRGAATSSVSFFRSIGGVFGTAILTAIINARMAASLKQTSSSLSESMDDVGVITDPLAVLQINQDLPADQRTLLQELLGDAVQYGFWFLFISALIGFFIAFWAGNAKQAASNKEELSDPIEHPVSVH